jgi:dTDP-glucose 4,6-dehydratase
MKKAIESKNIIIRNSFLPKRDNLYLEDAVRGLIVVAEKGLKGEAYNISSNNELGNYAAPDEIAEVIASEVNRLKQSSSHDIKVIFEYIKTDQRPPGLILNNSKLKALGWNVETDLRTGIYKTAQLFCDKSIDIY